MNEAAHHDDHDRGLSFDLATLMHRRGMLKLLGGAGLAALVGCSGGDEVASPAVSGGSGSGSPLATAGSGVTAASTAQTSTTSGASASTTATTGAAPTTTTTPATAPSSVAAATPTSCEPLPSETGGPFPGDGSNGANALNQSGVVRRDIRSSFASASGVAAGVPLTYKLRLLDSAKGCQAISGAAVYIWQCDANGLYSMYSQGAQNENYLRGVQVSDTTGYVTFRAIFPAAYPGRWPHLHFEVFPSLDQAVASSSKLLTSQLAMPEAACNEVFATEAYASSARALSQLSLKSDNVFRDGVALQTAAVTGSPTAGYVASLDITL